MKIQARVFIGILIIVGIGFYFMLSWVVHDLEPQYRKLTEEPLVDASHVLASVAASTVKDGKIDVKMFQDIFHDVHSRSLSAQIYDFRKENVDFRVYITNASGTVIFDSNNGKDLGKDYSQWRDVILALRGEYGARTSHDDPYNPDLSVMYVASPVMVEGNIAGVLSIGKPTRTANLFVEKSRKRIIAAGAVVSLSVVFVGIFISGMIARPIQKLTQYAKAVRDGKRVALPPLGSSEIRNLGEAFEEMRDALEGKHYVEKYVQTLTHEVKSPISAIQGAVELLGEEMPPEQQAVFLKNIRGETERINTIIERLLLLSSLESRKDIHETEHLNLADIVSDIKESLLPRLKAKHLHFDISGDYDCVIEGERFLVRHAVVNLVQNAIDFSAEGGNILVTVCNRPDRNIELTVTDQGSGIPDYAGEKIYERFYSLKRPDTGRKSSGLGLSLVKEVVQLHRGSVTLRNAPGGGVAAVIVFPSVHRSSIT